jgi:hypothetical protein
MKFEKRSFATIVTLLLAGLLSMGLFHFHATGQDKSGSNAADKAGGAKPTASEEAAEKLRLAYSIARYGRASKSAEALILAAMMIREVPSDKITSEKSSEAGQAASAGGGKPKTNGAGPTPEALLAEAKQLANGDKALLAQIKKAEQPGPKSRGAVGGAKIHTDTVQPGTIDNYTISFRGGEPAVIGISGDGDTDLDLFVYDENGNLIGSDTDRSDDCVVRWSPRWTGPFRIKIKNLGGVYNRYVLVTN